MNSKDLEKLKMEFEKDVINKLIDAYGDSLDGKRIIAEKLKICQNKYYTRYNS